MTGGGGDLPIIPPPPAAASGGEFLLSLLQQRSNHQPQTPSPPQVIPSPLLPAPTQPPLLPPQQQQQQQQSSSLSLDPAVAAVGPSVPFAPHLYQSSGRDLLSSQSPWPHNFSPPPAVPPGFLGFPLQNHPWSSPVNQFSGNQRGFGDELQRLGFSNLDVRASNTIHDLFPQKQQQQQQLQFGTFRNDVQSRPDVILLNSNSNLKAVKGRNRQFDPRADSNSKNLGGSVGQERQHRPPPGFVNKPRGGGNWDYAVSAELENNVSLWREEKRVKSGEELAKVGITRQLDHPGPPAGSSLHSVSAFDVEESLMNLEANSVDNGKDEGHELDDLGEELVGSLLHEDETDGQQDKKHNRHPREESRSDNRGQHILTQRMRMFRRQMQCRRDIDTLSVPFLSIYESLIPPEEEKTKQKQLLTLLETLVNKEWPEARLYLYGSCANSFGVSKSDIDVCLVMKDADVNKSEVLLKLADILQSDNLQNVQALTRARVPIVKLMDPVTGISCDICINNVLAVVNTKLLRDYAQIDVRLRQLAFIVKHWAKSRGVNETYQGTLSSYAYVLMCIHFLQQRRPAILPCLQEMNPTYFVTIDDTECSFFDQVEKLRGFGSSNRETIAQLVWAFFNYWAYRHDYANDVISVRTGSIISKREKDWTRRIGNDRHLICIEDPFETSHDLGRVVDKYSIRVLREEFERAAEVMQHHPNPCVTLFEPYVAR